MSWKDKKYDVGFGKLPKSTRFKKGKSGNPDGRPKGTRNFNTDLAEVLSEKVTVIKNGKPKKVSSQSATLMRLREKTLSGDPRALALFVSLAQQLNANKEATSSEKSLIAAEEDILQRYVDGMQKSAPGVECGKGEPEDG